GAVVWDNFIPGGAIGTSPAYNNGTVFVSTWDGNLYAWEASTGRLLQQLPLAPLGSSSSVALADGYLVVGDQAGGIDGFSFVGAGGQLTFGAGALDRYDNPIPGATFTWSVAGGIGTITASGVFTASTTTGSGVVTATTGSGPSAHTGAANVEIVPGALASLEVNPSTVTIAAGSFLFVNAEGFDAYHNQISGLNFA